VARLAGLSFRRTGSGTTGGDASAGEIWLFAIRPQSRFLTMTLKCVSQEARAEEASTMTAELGSACDAQRPRWWPPSSEPSSALHWPFQAA
jgi:hypothetical protein